MMRSNARSWGVAEPPSERLHYDEKDDDDEDRQRRNFIEPTVEDVAVPIAVLCEIAQQSAEIDVKGDQQRDQRELRVQPDAGDSVAEPQPQPKDDRQRSAGCHDAAIQLALHRLEPLVAKRIA